MPIVGNWLATVTLRAASFALFVTVALLYSDLAAAAPPWTKLAVFKRAEVEQDFTLADKHGPWLILAATFTGDDAHQQAKALATELRQRYKLRAYVHEMQFGEGSSTEGQGRDQFGDQKRMRYARQGEMKEVGVMIGDYATVDDSLAQKTLERLRFAQPECLKSEGDKQVGLALAAFRSMQKAVLPDGSDKKRRGPMGHAFITTNPLLPREYFVPNGLDKFVLKLNEDVEYSLLKCPGSFTLKVATFTGSIVTKQDEIREVQAGGTLESRLADAGEKARRLTLALRAQGIQAYEFHDRYSSLVTVGSFDSVGSPRSDGKIEINPQIFQLMKRFSAPQDSPAGQAAGVIRARTFDGIPLDAQPMIVEVPRASVGSALE